MKSVSNIVLALTALYLLAAARADTAGGMEPTDESTFVTIELQSHANQKLSADFHGYPGNNLKELARGRQTASGVEFEIGEKYIQLASKRAPDWPEQVEGIKVGREVQKLHFLHATGWGYPHVKDGTPIGSFVVHFNDGSSEVIPIEYGRDVRDWWALGDKQPVTRGEIAWNGVNEASQDFRGERIQLRLFKTTWENPHAGKEVTTIDYTSRNETVAAPFLIAITAERATDKMTPGKALKQLKELGAYLEFGDRGRVTQISLSGPGPRQGVNRGTDEAACLLAHLPSLEKVDINNSSVTDEGVKCLKKLPNLRSLSLNLARVSDAGLAHLQNAKSLETLHLHQTKITDAGLRHLEGLGNLKVLDVSGTRVSDEGLRHLEELSSLEKLDLRNTQVTKAGAERLKQKLPNARILHNAQ